MVFQKFPKMAQMQGPHEGPTEAYLNVRRRE